MKWYELYDVVLVVCVLGNCVVESLNLV